MKHILLPTDFSDNSWNAIVYAMQLYKDEDCKFYLFNAYTPIIYQAEYTLVGPAQFGLIDSMSRVSKEGLKNIHERILKEFENNPKHKFETISKFESVIFGIRELIQELQIDLVIMGTTGATGAKEVLFGSNTVQALKEMKCPIMAIPAGFTYDPPHEILFPSDLKAAMSGHLHILREIAVAHNARLNLMHVSTGYELTEKQQGNKQELESLFRRVSYLFHDLENTGIAEAINSFQVKHKINFLVMINNKHSFFENLFFKNTINQIGFHLKVPFLIFSSANSSAK